MAYAFNKVLLMGRLTRDPELRFTPQGTPVAKFGLAINRNFTSKTGERKEQVTFVDVTAWARTAEICHQYLKKGSPLFLEGRLDLNSWETADGQKRSKLEVVAETVQFLGGRVEGGGGGGEPSAAPADSPAAEGPERPPEPAAGGPAADETLPF